MKKDLDKIKRGGKVELGPPAPIPVLRRKEPEISREKKEEKIIKVIQPESLKKETKAEKAQRLAAEQGYISLTQASQAFSIPRNYLNVLIHRKKVQGKKFGRNWYTTEDSIKSYLKKIGRIIEKPVKKVEKPAEVPTPESVAPVSPELEKLNKQLAKMSEAFGKMTFVIGGKKFGRPKLPSPFKLPFKYVAITPLCRVIGPALMPTRFCFWIRMETFLFMDILKQGDN